jgi:tyrosinase
VADFANDPTALDAFRAGVRVMRERKPDDPLGWVFQANMHWRPLFPVYVYEQADAGDDPAARLFRDDPGFVPEPNVFNQCPHGNWWFLPWHRAYLHFFERILRHAAGEPTLTLPYWNYSDPAQRELPAAFREPKVKGQPNPLYLPDSVTFRDRAGKDQVFPLRHAPLNQGLTGVPASATGLGALGVIPFTTSMPQPAGQGFGSPRACDPTCGCGTGALEAGPHDKLHVLVGGSTATAGGGRRVGFMGDVPTAARDPIFWLHHANIDRLWESWLALKEGRANPEDPDWLDRAFSFYDVGPDGKPKLVSVTVRSLLSTEDLGYRYATLEQLPRSVVAAAPPAPLEGRSFQALAATPAPKRAPAEPGAHPPPEEATGVRLKNVGPTDVRVPLATGVAPEGLRAATKGEEKGELVLSLEGIEFGQAPGVYYEAYINLPAGEKPDVEGPYHVGPLTFFGLQHHQHAGGHGAARGALNVKLALTPRLRTLLGEAKADLKVTFVPETGMEPIRKGVEAGPPAAQAVVAIRQVRLLLIR